MPSQPINFKLEGVNEVINALKELNPKELAKLIVSVERKALNKFIIRPVRQALPYSQQSKKGIKIKKERGKKTSLFAGLTKDAYWLRFTELGTVERHTKSGKFLGAIESKPHISQVIESNTEPLVNWFSDNFGEEINKKMESKLKRISKK